MVELGFQLRRPFCEMTRAIEFCFFTTLFMEGPHEATFGGLMSVLRQSSLRCALLRLFSMETLCARPRSAERLAISLLMYGREVVRSVEMAYRCPSNLGVEP